jgi:hypothetical protein
MRFIVMHKTDAKMEAAAPPSQEIIRKMGELVEQSRKNHVFENGAGLHRSAVRVRLECRAGKCTLTEGPYTGKNELVFALLLVRTASKQQAVEQAQRVADVLGNSEIEIGPVVEPWDLGFIPRPATLETERFLLLVKGDARSESNAGDAKARAALSQLSERMKAEGVLLTLEMLAPTSSGKRLPSAPGDKRLWIDGPFAESKELIAGFSILNLPTRDEAVTWAERYAAILDGNEVDVRELLEQDTAL